MPGTLCAWPTFFARRAIGLCELTRGEDSSYTREELRWVEAIVGQAEAALRNVRLHEQVQQERQELQALSRHLVQAQEEERRRVARELHDRSSQVLVSLKMQLRLLEGRAEQEARFCEQVNELTGLVESVMDELHGLAVGLRPPCLDSVGLVAAIDQYCETLCHAQGAQGAQGLRIEFKPCRLRGRLPAEMETALYRIVQEAVANVVCHAAAHRARVVLEKRPRRLAAVVEDDGIGFDPVAARHTGRLGLIGMRERAEAVGGWLTIDSAPGAGTRVRVEVPCDN